jgi:hypothetical protein
MGGFPGESCLNCTNYHGDEGSSTQGVCRQPAPTIVVISTPGGPKPISMQPFTRADDWCSHWNGRARSNRGRNRAGV